MAKRIAINGFGRIGRLFYRALHERNFLDGAVEVVAVNDLVDAENLAYLLKYDSAHGKMNADVSAEGDVIRVDDREIKSLAMKVGPDGLPWADHGVDLVIESTGLFTKDRVAEGHVNAGAKNAIVSAPCDSGTKTIVMGVNDDTYTGEAVVSNASCTTNCLAPVIHVLLKEGFGVAEGIMTTAHAYTASQSIVDGISKKDPRAGRAAAVNIIPTSTGAAKAVGLAIPEVQGKLTGMAFRVPSLTGSVVDLTLRTEKETSLEEINAAMKRASETYLNGILDYTEEPVVSTDFVHDPHSSIYDATAGIELNNRFFKLISWYDNEWGYSNRLVDLTQKIIDFNN